MTQCLSNCISCWDKKIISKDEYGEDQNAV